jgi:hypothetical protein
MNTEINLNEEFGYRIFETVVKYNLRHNLEIGSWDGEGSTICFVEAMKMLSGDKKLSCIEIEPDRCNILKRRFQDLDFVETFNGSSISYNDLLYKNFDDIWNSEFNKIEKHKYSKELVESWFARDCTGMKEEPVFLNKDSPAFDGVLIDGSEFTGYSEFHLLKDKTKIFFLDDVHRGFKCYQIYDELKKDSNWNLIFENGNIRNGYAIFVNKKYD